MQVMYRVACSRIGVMGAVMTACRLCSPTVGMGGAYTTLCVSSVACCVQIRDIDSQSYGLVLWTTGARMTRACLRMNEVRLLDSSCRCPESKLLVESLPRLLECA